MAKPSSIPWGRAALTGLMLAVASPGLAQRVAEPGPASAETPAAPAPAPDPERLALARQLFEIMHMETAMRGIMDTMLKNTPKIVTDAAARDKTERLTASLAVGLDSVLPDMTDEMILVYAQSFTVRELRDTVDYYESPSGQAMLHKVPLVMQAAMPRMMALSGRIYKAAEADYCARQTCAATDRAMFHRMEAASVGGRTP